MMTPAILQSPFLSLPLINKSLANPSLPPTESIQLLSAKIHLLTNTSVDPPQSEPSASASSSRLKAENGPMEELDTRLELARVYCGMTPRRWMEAESELTVIEGKCKKWIKRTRRTPEEHTASEARLETSESKGDEKEDDEPPWVDQIRRIRVKALKELIQVEEALGRAGRAKRWRQLVSTLEAENVERERRYLVGFIKS